MRIDLHPEIAAVLNGERDWCLIHGDCREILPTLPDKSVNAIVTDAPYGVGIDYGCFNDTAENVRDLASVVVPEFKRIAECSLVFTGIRNMFKWPEPTWTLGWFSPGGSGNGVYGFSCWHPILAYGRDRHNKPGYVERRDAIHISNTDGCDKDSQHPCPKPMRIMRWTIDRASPLNTDVICDPFCGAGETGVQALKMGRRFIGIELDERWIPRARQRLEAAHSQQRLAV